MTRPPALPLTDPAFWDQFWGSVRLPALPDSSRRYERCFIEFFDEHLPRAEGARAFEAGCAPGLWLAHLARRFGYAPSGCDTSPRGVALTRENFKLLGLAGEIAECDLLSYQPERPFDLVLSFGFIEHFSDPAPILAKHLELLKPGGLLVLEVPNLTGLNAWLQTPEFLAAHNPEVMRRDFLAAFAQRSGLETIFLDYFGGFEPDNLGPPRTALARRAALKILRQVRKLPGTGKLNSALWSGFILGLFRKKS